MATTSRTAASGSSQRASSSRRGTTTTGSGTGQTQAKNRRKRKKDATPAPSGGGAESAQNGKSAESTQTGAAGEMEGEPEPPRKKRAYRRRARVQNAGHGNNSASGHGGASIGTTPTPVVGGGAGHHDDMMQLTEQFAQQHYRNIVSQVAPTPPPLQQVTGYAPTSLSFYGIPVLMETSYAASSTAPPVQLTSTSGFQISLPPISEVMVLPPTSITSSSLSVTSSQSQATSTMPQLAGLQMTHAYNPLTMSSSQILPLATQSLQGYSSFPRTPALTRSSQSVATYLPSHFPTAVSLTDISAFSHSAQPHTLSNNLSSGMSTASPSATTVMPTSSPSQRASPSSTTPTISSLSQIHLTSLPRMQISQPSPTQTSPTTPIVSSPSAAVTEASQSLQDSSHGRVSRGQTQSVSIRSQVPSDQVVFPKGPSFITMVRHPRTIAIPSRPLNTAPSSSSSYSGCPHTNTAPSPYIQPHASLLAPEFRQNNLFSAGTATARTSVCTPSSSTSTTASDSRRRHRDSNFGVATVRRSTRGTRALATGSVSSFSGTFGDTPYPNFGISIPRSSAHVPSTSISFTSVTDSTSSIPGNSYHHCIV